MKLSFVALTASTALPVRTNRFLSQEMLDQYFCTIEVPLFQHPEHRKRLHRQLPHGTTQELAMHNGQNAITGKIILQQLCFDPVF